MKTLSIRLYDQTAECLEELKNSLVYKGFSSNDIISYLINKELRNLYPEVAKKIEYEYFNVQ